MVRARRDDRRVHASGGGTGGARGGQAARAAAVRAAPQPSTRTRRITMGFQFSGKGGRRLVAGHDDRVLGRGAEHHLPLPHRRQGGAQPVQVGVERVVRPPVRLPEPDAGRRRARGDVAWRRSRGVGIGSGWFAVVGGRRAGDRVASRWRTEEPVEPAGAASRHGGHAVVGGPGSHRDRGAVEGIQCGGAGDQVPVFVRDARREPGRAVEPVRVRLLNPSTESEARRSASWKSRTASS